MTRSVSPVSSLPTKMPHEQSVDETLVHITYSYNLIIKIAIMVEYLRTWGGGRKPAPSRNLFGSAKKCRGSLWSKFAVWKVPACFFFFSRLSILSLLCNPSPLLPRYHFSSPCKLSCSEPQRTLLSVELRILSFFNMLASMFLVFSKLCLSSISCLFFKPFPAFPYDFSRVSFPQFPHFPNNFLNFPWFFQACH